MGGGEEGGGAVVFDTITAEGGVCTFSEGLVRHDGSLCSLLFAIHTLRSPRLHFTYIHSFIHLEFRKLSFQKNH